MSSVSFRFLNSLTGELEAIKTRMPGIINWYSCGPTVYDDIHLGHARYFLTQDIVRRVLEGYGRYQINFQMGITDIDDKIIQKARLEGVEPRQLAKSFELDFISKLSQLKIIPPRNFSRVTDNVNSIIEFVEALLKEGFAYQSSKGSIYFSIDEYRSREFKYPRLVKLTTEIKQDAVKNEEKRNQGDFSLWKACKEKDEPGWNAFGIRGRPGWHIECSAMIGKVLGSIDLHSGGVDLKFPHHENEIAQSQAITGCAKMDWCSQFIHFGHVYVNGQKMSKSLQNFIPLDEILQKYEPDVLRMVCLEKHYSSNIEFSSILLQEASHKLNLIRSFLANSKLWISQSHDRLADNYSDGDLAMLNFVQFNDDSLLLDNFNSPRLLQTYLDRISKIQRGPIHPLILSSFVRKIETFFNTVGIQVEESKESFRISDTLIQDLVDIRQKIRQLALGNSSILKQPLLELSDTLRDQLRDQGVEINDSISESTWSFKCR